MNVDDYVNAFDEKYFRFSRLKETEYWQQLLSIVEDDVLVSHFVFANDVLRIPPIKTFIMLHNYEDANFDNIDKQNIGAAFGCLFQEMLNYSENTKVSCRIANVKTAALFVH